ncbi:MAG: hypothetical protein ACRBCT_00240 [Alphaproteobacteria bacterium]
MSKGWSEERRRKQAEAIRRHRPWEKSTGPKSQAGKAVSSQNALKHGLYGVNAKSIEALLCANQDFIKAYKDLCQTDLLLERTDKIFNKINAFASPPPSQGGTK